MAGNFRDDIHLQRLSGTLQVDGGKHDYPLTEGLGLVGFAIVLGEPMTLLVWQF